jgi:predicted dehydrogenase
MAANRFGCELVRTGVIGRVKKVLAANFESPWECALPEQPVPQGLDWNTWCGQTDVVPYHIDIKTPRANPGWISFRPWSGGEMAGWGAHGFDQIQWALGTCLTGPVEVWSEGDPFRPPTYTQPDSIERGNKICSTPLVRMRYRINDNDVVMELGGGPRGGGTFVGENGTIIIDRAHVRSEPKEIVAEAMKTHHFQPGGDTAEHLANWIECVKSRQRPVADVEIGHRSATVCHLGNIARWVGRRLTWDPVSESFVGDDEANTLLARRQRDPYRIPDEA